MQRSKIQIKFVIVNKIHFIINLILDIMTTVIVIIAAASAAYEVLSRIIPTSKTWSIIGNVLNILKKISEALDNKKPVK